MADKSCTKINRKSLGDQLTSVFTSLQNFDIEATSRNLNGQSGQFCEDFDLPVNRGDETGLEFTFVGQNRNKIADSE